MNICLFSQSDYLLIPASELVDRKGYRAPGGPVRAGVPYSEYQCDPAVGDSPVSPSHTHTLPNSNSARYYTKSELLTPSDFQGMSGGDATSAAQVEEARALLEKLNTARQSSSSAGAPTAPGLNKGSSPLLHGSGPQQMSLKDIPLPPSGYQFMPPPNMTPSMSSVAYSSEPNASSIDPVTVSILSLPSIILPLHVCFL